ncbi:hypothetical protein [Aestuariibaculum suncheonense]|uniref:Uncharacterized protein n=1 Tax=Aestuariibaculum suncheonense TaxID=1028745 RepID=A0A8J6QXA0_9FLAO|nr:hypothetical protein [Aestuariibaculum suncheonense]MBD0836289.1 hypothetical protein [Aestuariibaculum suncheonense]
MVELTNYTYFTNLINDSEIYRGGSSGLVLIEQIVKYSERLKLEIKKNLLMLPNEKVSMYKDFVFDGISGLRYYNVSEERANSLISGYEDSLNDIECSHFKDDTLGSLLLYSYHEFNREDRDKAYILQHELTGYFTGKHISEILQLVKPKEEINEPEFDKRVFKSVEAFIWFRSTLIDEGYLNDKGNEVQKRGFQAFAKAILDNTDCRSLIFTHNVGLADYIDFLRKNYNVEISSNKAMSSGFKHESRVKYLVEIYKANKPQ